MLSQEKIDEIKQRRRGHLTEADLEALLSDREELIAMLKEAIWWLERPIRDSSYWITRRDAFLSRPEIKELVK